jgi:hypothetical protein
VSPRAYILNLQGAKRLCQTWQKYDSVEEQFMSEMKLGHFQMLLPGDARSIVHLDAKGRKAADAMARDQRTRRPSDARRRITPDKELV